MTTMYYASLDTGYFSFSAIGHTEMQARAAVRRAWTKHRSQTGAQWTWADLEDGCNVLPMQVGAGYREGLPLVGPGRRECDQCGEAFDTIAEVVVHRTEAHPPAPQSDDEVFGRFERSRS